MNAKEDSPEIILEEKEIGPTETMTNNTLRNLGSIIIVCSLLLLFGGETFAWWHISIEWNGDTMPTRFGTNEVYAYGDPDLDYSSDPALEGVFSVVKILLYLLLLCGAALTYMGQTGNKIEFEAETITGSIFITLLLIFYVFLLLPQAAEDDRNYFGDLNQEPAFFSSGEEMNPFIGSIYFTTGPSLGWFVSILILCLSATYLLTGQSLNTMLENIMGRFPKEQGGRFPKEQGYQRSMDIDEGVKYGFDMLAGIAKYLIIILIIEACGILFIMYGGGSEATIVIGGLLFIVGSILGLALSIGIMYKLWVDILARSRE